MLFPETNLEFLDKKFDHENGTTMENFSKQQFCGTAILWEEFFSPTEMLSHRSDFRILSVKFFGLRKEFDHENGTTMENFSKQQFCGMSILWDESFLPQKMAC